MGNGLGIDRKVAVLSRVAWVGLTEKVTPEQPCCGGEEVSPVNS